MDGVSPYPRATVFIVIDDSRAADSAEYSADASSSDLSEIRRIDASRAASLSNVDALRATVVSDVDASRDAIRIGIDA